MLVFMARKLSYSIIRLCITNFDHNLDGKKVTLHQWHRLYQVKGPILASFCPKRATFDSISCTLTTKCSNFLKKHNQAKQIYILSKLTNFPSFINQNTLKVTFKASRISES